MAACSKGGECAPVHHSETATEVTHRCSKCGTLYSRPKGNRLFVVLMLAMIAVAVVVTIWGAPVT